MMNQCEATVKVENYGGGVRYHCPSCDVRRNEYQMPMASWTNASPPQDRRCTKQAVKP